MDLRRGGRREFGILRHPPCIAAVRVPYNLGPRGRESNAATSEGRAQAAATQTAVSWNTALTAGGPAQALVSRLMPQPSSQALFGQMLSTTPTSGCRPSNSFAWTTNEPLRF